MMRSAGRAMLSKRRRRCGEPMADWERELLEQGGDSPAPAAQPAEASTPER